MNTMSILSALSDSGFCAVGNVVFPLTFPELMIGEDDDSHVALFETMDYSSYWCDRDFDWYESDLWSSMWDDIEADQRQADRDEAFIASWLRGEWSLYLPSLCLCCGRYR